MCSAVLQKRNLARILPVYGIISGDLAGNSYYVCRYCGVEPNWQYGALVIVSLQDCSPVEYFSNT